jgi:hypothetical protein
MSGDVGAFDALLSNLTSQRQAIRDGDLTALAPLGARAADLADIVASAPSANDDHAALKREAERLRQLLGAVLQGVRSARRRVQAVRAAGTRFETYDSHGHARAVILDSGKVERQV